MADLPEHLRRREVYRVKGVGRYVFSPVLEMVDFYPPRAQRPAVSEQCRYDATEADVLRTVLRMEKRRQEHPPPPAERVIHDSACSARQPGYGCNCGAEIRTRVRR